MEDTRRAKVRVLRAFYGVEENNKLYSPGEVFDTSIRRAEDLVRASNKPFIEILEISSPEVIESGQEAEKEKSTEEDKSLEDMSYQELKKLAKEKGIPAKGKTEELRAAIMAAL